MEPEIESLINSCLKNYEEKKHFNYVAQNTFPILWFGNLDKYKQSKIKIVTVGINPSIHEFPLSENPRFLPRTPLNATNLFESYNEYFTKNPYKWFKNYENILEDNFDCTYGGKMQSDVKFSNQAIHIDACTPIVTDPLWGKLSEKEKQSLMNINLFNGLIDYLQPDIILFSACKNVFEHIFKDYNLHNMIYQFEDSKKRTYIRTFVKSGNKNTILFWGTNHGTPFAHMNRDKIKDVFTNFKNNGLNITCNDIKNDDVILRDIDCFFFSNEDKIRIKIEHNAKHKKIIEKIYKAKDESSPIIVSENGRKIGEWEVEEYYDDKYDGKKFSFFQLIPFLHIWIKQEPDKMYHSFERIDKHVISYEINDRLVCLDYSENRTRCGSANKILPVDLYKKLKMFLRSYFEYLNSNVSSFGQELLIMDKFPFGGVSVLPYSYKIGKKEAYNISPLFINLEDKQIEQFNKIIEEITEL